MDEMNNTLNTAEEKAAKKPKTSLLKETFDYFELFILSACAVLLLFSFATRICRVDGPSMLNTLHDSEMLLVTDIFYTPSRGDIVVFHQTGDQPSDLNEPIVKRVIATEGEWIDIKTGLWLFAWLVEDKRLTPAKQVCLNGLILSGVHSLIGTYISHLSLMMMSIVAVEAGIA